MGFEVAGFLTVEGPPFSHAAAASHTLISYRRTLSMGRRRCSAQTSTDTAVETASMPPPLYKLQQLPTTFVPLSLSRNRTQSTLHPQTHTQTVTLFRSISAINVHQKKTKMAVEISKVTLEIFSKLEKQWLFHCEGSNKKTRVLTIDGGGTTGIVAGASLIQLEDQIQAKTGDSNARIVDYFDIIAGTGIGALLAVMLNADDGNGRPLFTARDAVKFVNNRQTELYKLKNAGVFRRRRRFSGKSMDKVLKEILTRDDGKVLTLKDTCKPLLIPCFDLHSSAPFVFSRADASQSASYDFELWKVCRATSADPSMFKPFPLTSVDGKTSCLGIHGGLVTNNPTAIALTHALHNKRDFPSLKTVEDLVVISIGNGNGSLNISSQRKLDRNGRCLTSSVVDIVLAGVSDTVDQMLGNAFCWNRTDYVRIQANCYTKGKVGPTMEEVLMERGVESLPFGAKRLLTETNGKRIEGFVERLVASRRSSLPASPCKDAAVTPLVHGR